MVDGLLELDVDGQRVAFAFEQRARAPYPNEIGRLEALRARVAAAGHPVLVAPFISSTVGEALVGSGWSWADERGNYALSAPGVRLRRRMVSEPSPTDSRRLPAGSGSSAIIRQLINGQHGARLPSVTDLARVANVSQPRASQVLAKLTGLGLVSSSTDCTSRFADREMLLDRFLAEYRGPGGSAQYLYSLDPSLETARRAALAAVEHRDLAVSADVGPDLLAPWRRPTVLVLYSSGGISAQALGAVPAQSPDSANVVVRAPRDRSVFPTDPLVARYDGVEIPLADPVQMVWDLQALGGAEREEAAGVMREWILNLPS